MDNKLRASKAAIICYAFGDIASQFVWTFVGSYLTIFYTDVVGLAPAAVSAIMMVARIWDAFNDPMMGAIAICGVAGVLLLTAVGYVPNAEQTEAAKTGISAVVNLMPAICGILFIMPLKFDQLTKKSLRASSDGFFVNRKECFIT